MPLTNPQPPITPDWLEATLLEKNAANSKNSPSAFMKEGRRNTDLTSIAGLLRRKGESGTPLFDKVQAVNLTIANPVDSSEVQAICNSVSRNYSADAKGDLHELPVSRMVAENIASFCKFVPETGWRVYNGQHWQHDPSGIYAKERIKIQLTALVEAVKVSGDLEAVREARKYLANAKINAVMSLAMSDPNIVTNHENFDAKALVLNLRNGTLDLETGQLKPHEANDLLTKMANVDFDPTAECPNFKKVLAQSLPFEHRAFMLRYLGYSLMGEPREQIFAIPYGVGANGKSTLINAVQHALGDYAANVEPTTLMKQKSEKVRSDVERLQGVRLAITSELGMGEILDAPLIKRFTGGDKITARALYKSEIEYTAKFSLVMTTNSLPVINVL